MSYGLPADSGSQSRPASYYDTQQARLSHPPQDPHKPLNHLYYESPYDRDEPFDVRADFDGNGPRWSELYGANRGDPVLDSARETGSVKGDYRPVSTHIAPNGYGVPKSAMGETSREEMVSVPVLGPEWQKSELHELSRRGQAELKQERRGLAWRAWTRDQRGLCGVHWLTRRALVFALFSFVAALVVTLYFTLPRAPHFSFYEPDPFTVDNSTVSFSRTPTNFSFTGNLNLLADSTSSYLPVRFSNIQTTLLDLDTEKVIATGNSGRRKLAHGSSEPIVLPVQFSYSAVNASDTTWNDMYTACGHLWTGTVRPDLKFRLEVKMHIVGLVTQPISETQISDVACPFELSANSV